MAWLKIKNKLKLIDAPVYRYWDALYMSFYSRRLYVDVGKRWRGLGITLSSICYGCIIYSIYFKNELGLQSVI